jgi:hypothetical protein
MDVHRIPSIETLGEAGDLSAPPGSRLWAIAMRGEMRLCLNDTTSNRDRLTWMHDAMIEHKGYLQLVSQSGTSFRTFRSFCEEPKPWGLGYSESVLQKLIEEYKTQTTQERIQIAAQVTNGETPPRGGDRKSNEYKSSIPGLFDLDSRAEANGISPATQWRLDYLARNAPELHEAVKRGEVGARPAYEQARGKTKIEITPNVDEAARKLAEYFSQEDLATLIALLVARVAQ